MSDAPLIVHPFEVEGMRLAAGTRGRHSRLTGPPDAEALCEVVNTAFLHDPETLLTNLIRRTGQSFEGVASYGFHREYPSRIPLGMVTVDYFDAEMLLRQSSFIASALTLAGNHLDCNPGLGWRASHDAVLRKYCWRLRRPPTYLRGRFTPRMRVDVFDEAGDAAAAKIAEVYSDGEAGRLLILDTAFHELLLDLFAAPSMAFPAFGVPEGEGVRPDPAPVVLPAFAPQTLAHLCDQVLKNHRLSGRMVPDIAAAWPPLGAAG